MGLLFGSLCVAQAQTTTNIDWFKVAGGGGTSTGGTYQVSGTIGQHDAGGPLSNGNYTVTGGFWSIYAVQTPDAPTLTITFVAPHSVVVSWSLSAADFVLQTNVDLTTTNWGLSSYLITTNVGIESITITSPPPGNLFFRLSHP
jgi:hypothetical protein